MNKIIAFALSLVLLFSFAKGQTPLTTAVDFKAIDVNGRVHSLFHYLDDDKIVLMMFTSLGCWSCSQSYPYLQSSFEEFGCNFGNVITMLVSPNHSYDVFQGEPFNHFGSFKIPAPIGTNIVSDYSIFAYPTFVLILPDRTIAEQDIYPVSEEILRNKILEHGGVLMECPDVETIQISVAVSPENAGSIRGAGHHIPGTLVELSAIPNPGWVFESWTNQNSDVVHAFPEYGLVVPQEDVLLTANFRLVVSVDETMPEANSPRLFPNPASETIFVSLELASNTRTLVPFIVLDAKGKKVMQGTLEPNNLAINVSKLDKGYYLLKLPSANLVLKFVKH